MENAKRLWFGFIIYYDTVTGYIMTQLGPRLKVYRGDITTLAVDAIVNAANETLLGGGGVDGAIHRAAGPDLLACCRRLGGCPTGDARITPGFDLPARFIIHTVGPVWHGGQNEEAELLASCYRRVFALAEAHGVKRLGIPAISCGVYGYPIHQAAMIAVRESSAALATAKNLQEVFLVAFSGEVATACEQAIAAIS